MFKNRSLLVKMVKDNEMPEKDVESIQLPDPIDYVQIVRETGKDAVIAAGALIGGYVVLDTFRKVTIEIVKAKL